jgi:hypothetical protein
MKIVVSILCLTVIFSGAHVSAATSELPPGILIGDQDGIRVNRDGAYAINAVNLKPGDVIRKTLTIRNTDEAAPFKLYMTAQPMESTGPVDLLDRVQLRLELNGRTIYAGRVRGDEDMNMIENALDLGTYAYGDEREMNITLTVDEDLPISYKKSASDIQWNFYAVRDALPDPPKTGEDWLSRAMLLTAVLLVCATIYMLVRKHRNQAKEGDFDS